MTTHFYYVHDKSMCSIMCCTMCCNATLKIREITREPSKITCPKCISLYAEMIRQNEKQIQDYLKESRTFKGIINNLDRFGGGEWGVLEWIAVGPFAPFVWLAKRTAKVIKRIFYKD